MPVRTPHGLAGVLLLFAAVSFAETARDEGSANLESGRVVLVPLNLAVRAVPEVEPGVAPVWAALLQYFAAATNLRVAALEPNGAGSLWNEVMADAGESAPRDLYAVYGRFARRVAEQSAYDHIVFSTLVTRSARVAGDSAIWDGVHQMLVIPVRPSESVNTLPNGDLWIIRNGARGQLAAASLHVAVLSPAGELIFENTGGLVLLQDLAASRVEGEIRVVPRERAFDDAARLRDGIAVAFHTVRRPDEAELER